MRRMEIRENQACERLVFFGGPVKELVARIWKVIEKPAGATFQVVFLNGYGLHLTRTDSRYRALCTSGALVVPDGISVVYVARWKGMRAQEKCGGADVLHGVLRGAELRGRELAVAVLAPSERVGAEIERQIPCRYEGVKVVQVVVPPYGDPERWPDGIRDVIRNAGADLLITGVSSPKQDIWIANNRDRLGVQVALGVGAALEFMVGIKRRPKMLVRMGFFWMWRLLEEPARLWPRYVATGRAVVAELWGRGSVLDGAVEILQCNGRGM